MTLSRSVSHGSSVGFWNAMPTRTGSAPTSRPRDEHVAARRAESDPVTSLRIVDLPQPDGPTSATKSPFSIRRSVSVERAAPGARRGHRCASPSRSSTNALEPRRHRCGAGRCSVTAASSCGPLGSAGGRRRSPAWSDRVAAAPAAACAGWRAPSGPSRACPATSARSFMTKRPRTSVCMRQALHAAAVPGRDLGARLQLGVVDRPLARRVDDRDVGVRAGLRCTPLRG